MENPFKSFFTDLKKLVAEYIETRLQLVKVSAYEKLAKILSAFFAGLILVIMFFVVIVAFIFFLGAWLNEIFNSRFIGFAIVAVAYFVFFVLLLYFRKQLIEKYFTKIFIRILFNEDEHNKN